MSEPTCPNAAEHGDADAPEDYIARALWYEAMWKTHKQYKCKGCGLYRIWRKLEGSSERTN